MADYSDIIFLMGAIIMFSMLTLSVNRTLLMNDLNLVGHEINYYALSVAQEEVDEIRWLRSEADLDQRLSDYPKMVNYQTDSGQSGTLPFNVDITKGTAIIENDEIRTIQLSIKVSSDYGVGGEGGNPVQLAFIKSFIK